MDKFTSMQVYCRVVARNGFSRAARDLRMSPAMVTRHVSDLEQSLGVRLLNRSTRKVSPTEAGIDYYRECLNLLDALEEIESSLAAGERRPEGLLRVSCPLDFGVIRMAPMLAGYLERHPGMRLDVDFNDRKVNLVEEGFDLAVRIGDLDDSSLVARRLASIDMVCCAAPAYLERYGEPRLPEDLARHRCLTYSYAAAGNDWCFEGDGSRYVVRVHGPLHASNGRAVVQVATAGCGVVLKPLFMVERELADGRLVRLLEGFRVPSVAIYAVYPHRSFLPVRVRSFIDFLAQRLAEIEAA
jgi:DNA-binding transcriptional LysR family regulator